VFNLSIIHTINKFAIANTAWLPVNGLSYAL
jgi:hypothetical protein